MVIGLDFAFSMPAWFLAQHQLPDGPALWDLAARSGEAWLAACEAPFWVSRLEERIWAPRTPLEPIQPR